MRLCIPSKRAASRPISHAAALSFVLLAACGGGDATAPCTVSAVTVTPSTAGVRVGGTTQLAASVNASNCSTAPTVVWSTGDAGVATVNNAGLVTAVAAGTTTISATAQSIQTGATITVSLVPVQSVTVTAPSTALFVGASAQAAAVVRDSAGATVTRPLTWTTSAASVATVNASGLVTAVGPGSAIITATAGGVAGTLAFTVTAPVASVSTTLSQSVLFVGTSTRPTASATTRDAGGAVLTGRSITWSSSNTAVATVDASTGVVTPVGVGTTNIRATSEGITGQSALSVSAMPAANNRFGYAWNHLIAAPIDSVYSPPEQYTANASGGGVRIRRTTLGRYSVLFYGAAKSGTGPMSEVAFVTTYGNGFTQCNVLDWVVADVTDLEVNIRCADLGGNAINASFNVALVGNGSIGGKMGFAWTPSAAGGLTSALHAYSTGGTLPTYARSALGSYGVNFATGALNNGSHVLMSTYGPNDRYCWGAGWSFTTASSNFQCAQASDNTLADARFVTMMLEAGRPDKRWAFAWNSEPNPALGVSYVPDPAYQRQSNGQSVSMVRTAVGVYTVTFTGLTRAPGQTDIILASPYGGGSYRHCAVPTWTAGATSTTAEVRCVDRRTGELTNSYFTIMLLE